MSKFVEVLDLSEKLKNLRKIVIGDLHGCYDSLMELLAKVNWNPEKDAVILLGDIVDRGPKIKECLEFARNTKNVYTLVGNHDHKVWRYLKGNKVNLSSLKATIEQCGDYLDDSLKEWLESLPFIIKFGPNHFGVHAGIFPHRTIYEQLEHSVLYSRTFNAKTNSISDTTAPLWWNTENVGGEQIFFGHIVSPDWRAGKHVALDGGCVFGEELRAWLSDTNEVISVKSNFAYDDLHSYKAYVNNPLLIEDDFVNEGLLYKREKGDLTLYTYTPKCVYEKRWNEVTMRSRGIVYDNKTKEVVGHCMPKFFNLGENEFSQMENLPLHLSYDVFSKIDGSLCHVFFHGGQWHTTTKGSFESDQAKEAFKIIFEEKNYDLHPDFSYTMEIIYPENRVSVGARLVVDHGPMRDVILITAYEQNTGIERTRPWLEVHAKLLGMPICKKYDLNINQAIDNAKVLPFDEEGYVIRFANGYRVKVKGIEYLKMHKILNSISPISIWEAFSCFELPTKYLSELPDEVHKEATAIAQQIYQKMDLAFFELKSFMMKEVPQVDKNDPEWRKKLGMWAKEASIPSDMKSLVFPFVLGKTEVLFKYIKNKAKPVGNEL
jgi:RNA ligase